MTEVPPLFVVEFLHRVVDTFEDYFSECSETAIKENYVVATEANILKELIKRQGLPAAALMRTAAVIP
jgi:AP-3 complex subunit mu